MDDGANLTTHVPTDNSTALEGPTLAFTTRYLRRGPRRIALRTKTIALPGTYRLSRVLGGAAGAAAGLTIGLPLGAGTGIWWFTIIVASAGFLLGVFATSWSPLKGESLGRWALLKSAKRTGLVRIGGRWVRAYVGVCPLSRVASGPTRVVAGFVDSSGASPAPTTPPAQRSSTQSRRGPARRPTSSPNPPAAPTILAIAAETMAAHAPTGNQTAILDDQVPGPQHTAVRVGEG